MKKVVSIIILITFYFQAFPCTSFILRENHNFYLCKNFDYFTGRGFIFINQRNDIKIGACIPPEKPSQWISKFGSITFNAYGKDLPMSGMNEKGLIIESLWLNDTEYPMPDDRQALPELGWIQYMLDNCSTVDEVVQADKQVRVANTSMAKIHFIILDANGKSAIVEIINGNTLITTGGNFAPEVIENQTYSQSLDFLKNNPLGQKCYEFPINDKRERFEMVSQMIKVKDLIENPFDYCFRILQKTTWTIENGDAPTQWSIVYDLKAKTIHYKTKDNINIKTINFNDFSFQCSDEILTTNMQTGLNALKTTDFHRYNIEEAKLHLRSVYEEVPFTKGKLPDEMLDGVLNATNKKPCNK
jgi:penicillin V acylase-like amidase (Ntn superfamily)